VIRPDQLAGPRGPARSDQLAGPRGLVRADQVYLGWQPSRTASEAEPRPQPPGPATPDHVSHDWVRAQYREHRRLARPAWRAAGSGLGLAAASLALAAAGLMTIPLATAAGAAAALIAGGCAGRLWRDGRALAAQLTAEDERVAQFAAVQRDQQQAQRQRYVRQLKDWQQREAARRRLPSWHPVTLPAGVSRLDVAGGTLAGWSALLTMLAAPRLAAGGEVTVLDLTEGGVAADLLAVARRCGTEPAVWVLPADLPRLRIARGLNSELVADILARTVAAADGPGSAADPGRDTALDAALLSRVLGVLGSQATMAHLLAAVRAVGQIGGPPDHLGPAELTPGQLASLATLAGRGAERLVIDRAWAIEARLRALALLGSAPAAQTASRLQVTWLDPRGPAGGAVVQAAYLAIALTASLRQSPPQRPWQHTICLLGAERLPGEVLDRLTDATEAAGAGLVLSYRTIPAHVRDRLGRGNAALAFMRLGNAEDARLAAEQIGTEHRVVLSQLTESVGSSVTGTAGDSYTSTAGTADSVADSISVTMTRGRSRGLGRSRQGTAAFGDVTGSASRDSSSSAALAGSRSITEGISTGTSWGWSTSAAIGTNDSLASTAQRSREFLVEQNELQQLPHSALLLCYPAAGGRQVVLADANPAIMSLPTATFAAPGSA
jgi:hypothetical protein